MEHLEKVGPYSIVSKIGDGGMAEVFKARVERAGGFEKQVALKKILPHVASNEKFRRNFINEATICGKLHHHNIVEVYDFIQQGTDLYLAMEFIDGLNLEEVFEHHRQVDQALTSDVILSILVQVLEGLDYAHKATDPDHNNEPLKVIHRDLKPSNILIDNEGVVKIVDFGVAKSANRPYETQEMTAKGTASYMSPEQLLGDREVIQAADMFSVGTIFYELLTLNRLFDGEHVFAILKQVAMMDIEDNLNRTITGADRKFLPMLRRALAREPEERYQSGSEMLRDLLSLHVMGISPRHLADHLRKIRNLAEQPEDARTRLMTSRDVRNYIDRFEDDGDAAQSTQVASSTKTPGIEDPEDDTISGGETVALTPQTLAPRPELIRAQAPVIASTRSHSSGGSGILSIMQPPAPMPSPPVSEPELSPQTPHRSEHRPESRPEHRPEHSSEHRPQHRSEHRSESRESSSPSRSRSMAVYIGPIREQPPSLLPMVALGLTVGVLILLLLYFAMSGGATPTP